MKRLGPLTVAASLGLVMISSGPVLAFDGEATPPIFLASPTMPLSFCLNMEKQGYPNPGGDDCSYLGVSPAYYSDMWNPETFTGRSVAIYQMGMMCATPMMICELRHESFVGKGCSCNTADGRVWGIVTR
jgi:hypothetical protein